MSGLRVCLLTPCLDDDPWHAGNLRAGFAALAGGLARAGCEVSLPRLCAATEAADPLVCDARVLRPQLVPAHPALVAGPGPGALTEVLRRGYRVAQFLKAHPPDIVLAPLRRGLLQPLSMARAAGEGFADTAVCVWADAPTVLRLRDDDTAVADPAPLVDDALERTMLGHADLLVAASASRLQGPLALARPDMARALAPLPPPEWQPSAPAPGAAPPHSLAFCGPGTRRYGLPAFLDAAEELARGGWMTGRRIQLLGTLRADAPGLSKTLLGVRAQDWDFEFGCADAATPRQAWPHLLEPGVLAVFAGASGDDDALLAAAAAAGLPIVLAAEHGLADAFGGAAQLWQAAREPLAQAVLRAAAAPLAPSPPTGGQIERWHEVLHEAWRRRAARRLPPTAPPRLAVCITHRDRPDCLRRALDSVAADAAAHEVVVVDNASRSAPAQDLLQDLRVPAGRCLQLLRLPQPLAQAAACNLAARSAAAEVLVFLDDDNLVAPEGLSRLARALADPALDLVVSCLDLYDDPGGAAAARLVFMGDAGSAGLFFNGFGDTAMAVRREAFVALGGFEDGPALDWVFLARARAAGLRIGVLQEPAVRYARDLRAAQRRWRKRDQEAARNAVLRAYAGRFDAELVARVAQGATLHEFLV